MKKIILLIMSISFIIIAFIVQKSYAYPNQEYSTNQDNKKLNLELTYNASTIESDIKQYIDLIDNSVIPNFEYSSVNDLFDNYDFLTTFAINFIIDNQEYYQDKIKQLDEYIYIDQFGNECKTNKYIDSTTLYDITYPVFNKRYYVITNEYLTIKDDLIPLLDLTTNDFNMTIEEILNIKNANQDLTVEVKYDNNDLIYIYNFYNPNNKFFLKKIAVKE